MKNQISWWVALFFCSQNLWAQTVEPNPNPPKGGTFAIRLLVEPANLHPVLLADYSISRIRAWAFDTLAVRDLNTLDWKPRLASKWELSKDSKTLTLELRNNAFFHDGKPVTAEDVKFTFDHVRDVKLGALHWVAYFESLEKIEILSPTSLKMYFKNTYFGNFSSIMDMPILPKHVYKDVDTSKTLTRKFVGSGPYEFDSYDKGNRVVLKKFKQWYGDQDSALKGYYNFDRLIFRFVSEEAVALEMYKKGDLDYGSLGNESYARNTEGPPWGEKVLKVAALNQQPRGTSMIGLNQKNELFKDARVRKALAHSLNRKEINEKFRYGLSLLASGHIFNQSPMAPSGEGIAFDMAAAAKLMAQAGWKDVNHDGVLEKTINGQKMDFRFTVLNASKDLEKYYLFWQEDLKKLGVQLEIRQTDWATLTKMMREGNFDAIGLQWVSNFDSDPKQVWHSESAKNGGSNYIRYANAKVDQFIDQARFETNAKKRNALFKKAYEIMAVDLPYIPMFCEKNILYAVSSRIGRPGDTFKHEINEYSWWVKP